MKNNLTKIVTCVVAFIVATATTLTAQVDRSKAPKAGAAPIIKVGKPATFTLPNGLRIFVVQNNKLPRVTATLSLDRDALIEGEKAGYTSLAGELMGEGTKTKSKDVLDEEVDFLGADLNTSSTSATINALTNNFNKAFGLMADVVLNPAFSADELENIKKRTISGLQSEKDNPSSITSKVVSKLMYGSKHPYGEFDTEKSIEKVTLADIKKYYNTYWKPNIAYLVFVGDITPANAQKLALQHFGKWKRGVVPKFNYPTVNAPAKTQIAIVDRPASVQSVITITSPVQLKPNSTDLIASRVMNNILGESATARLFMNLREKHGFTYGAYSSLSSDKLVGTFRANASVRNEKTDSAIQEFINEFKRMKAAPVEKEELETVKNYLAGGFARSLESPSTIASFALNTVINKLPADYYQNYLTNLDKVNIANVQQMANKYIAPNNIYIVIVGNAKEIAKGLEKYGEIKYYDFDGNETKPATSKAVEGNVTALDIVKKYITALGGEEAISKIADIQMNGNMEIPGAPFKPDVKSTVVMGKAFVRNVSAMNGAMVLQKQSVINGVYKEEGQMVAGKQMDDEDKEELNEETMLVNELYYLKNGYTMQVNSIETVEGKDAYEVAITSNKGRKFTNYYEVASGLKVKTVAMVDDEQGKKVPMPTWFADYKTYNGVQIPTKIIIDQGVKMTLMMSDIKVNTGVKAEDLK
jgi:zinc protease